MACVCGEEECEFHQPGVDDGEVSSRVFERPGSKFVAEVPAGYEDALWVVAPNGSIMMAKSDAPPIWLPASHGKWQSYPFQIDFDGWPTRDRAAFDESC